MVDIDEDGCECRARVPNKWEYEPDEDEVLIVADDDEMQRICGVLQHCAGMLEPNGDETLRVVNPSWQLHTPNKGHN